MKATYHITATLLFISGMSISAHESIVYPKAPHDESVVDTYFDNRTHDPFRPLENDTSAETSAWVKAENLITQTYLSKIPFRHNVRMRLAQLNNYKKTGLPWRDNDGLYYFYINDGLKNQAILYRATTPYGNDAEVFLDPNILSVDGTVALTGTSQSQDGRYTAYTISRNGSDWTEIYLIDTKTAQPLDDHIEWAKFTSAQWHGDGFYYSAYPHPETGKEYSNANENHQIYYHRIGTDQSQDRLVYEDPTNPLHFHTAWVPDSQDYLFVFGGGQGFGESLMFRKLTDSSSEWTVIEASQDYEMSPIGVRNDTLYMLTSLDAPRLRLVAIDLNNPAPKNWNEVISQGDGVLKSAMFSGDNLIVSYQKDASDNLWVYDITGKPITEIKLPTYGSVSAWSSHKYPEVFYSFTSFTYPSEKYFFDKSTGQSLLLDQAKINRFNEFDYVTEQVFYPSADGTLIPMFITRHKNTVLDGKNPTLLYGYGGFNISLPPSFSPNRLFWLENGGIYAQANLRGGGEYGESWHQSGTKLNKKNVFNDFIAAAEYLIQHGYTTPERLAIQGGSNGGLLVGATANMRPDLFRVALPAVGVMDMMRYHLFTIGWNWASDYGTSADSPEMAQYLLSYSPLHNIRNDGTPYPAIMITTADHDDRVVPAHSFKYAAALQASNTGPAPKIIRIETNAGHGSGKPISKVLDENADTYSFIFFNMGLEPKSIDRTN